MRHSDAAHFRFSKPGAPIPPSAPPAGGHGPQPGFGPGFGPVRIALAITLAVSASTVVWAHSWYPVECCTGQDCRKVDTMEYLPDGSLRMLFSGQEVIIPKGFRQMPSQDTDAHVCVYRNASGRWVPRCVFVPAGA